MELVEAGKAPPEVVVAAAEPAPGPAEPETSAEERQETIDEPREALPAVPDHKRKHEELGAEAAPEEPGEAEATPAAVTEDPGEAEGAPAAVLTESAEGEGSARDEVKEAEESMGKTADGVATPDAKRQRLDGEAAGPDGAGVAASETAIENGQVPTAENVPPNVKPQETVITVPQQGTTIASGVQQSTLDGPVASRKIEVPNNKVGVLIGKAGETIRFLQFTSGAKIQITRDGDADPHSSMRRVELIGSIENINKAEKLIKEVIAEADAGGSPSLVARGLGASQPGEEQLQIQVLNEKVGLIIGKGGETIKSLQNRSGARIQLIPQHLPEGDIPKERTVRITGNREHIEAATEMIKVVMSQVPVRSSTLGRYTQQTYRPRGSAPQWGPRAGSPGQPMTSYGYQQRGVYPSQATQYPPPAYGSYGRQQPVPRGTFGTGWDQRAASPVQTSSQVGGYDYYGHGGHPSDRQTSATGPVPSVSGAPTGPMNYYGQSQTPGYGQPASYSQSTPSQSYGHGYDEGRYDSQAPSQQAYGQQPATSQPGLYPHPSEAPQSAYAQQQLYNKPLHGVPSHGMIQSYGPPRPTTEAGDSTYQGSTPYGPIGPTQQQPYPYMSSTPSQQVPGYTQPYGPPSGTADGYAQYPQQSGQAAPTYVQGTQPAPAYTQSAQSAGYGQYPSSQPSYGEQPVASNVSYGYQGGPSVDATYGNGVTASGYGAPSAGDQVGYAPTSNTTGYDQSVPPQAGFGNVPGSTPVGYNKSLSPQLGYGQYESTKTYAHH